MTMKARATIDDLYKIPDNVKAEIVDGEIVIMSPTGDMPARAGFKIAMSLSQMEGKIPGRAYPDNVGYRVSLPSRESFSPDASFHLGQPTGMRFLEGAPVFAVEVGSENDYGPNAEDAIAKKRADYFALIHSDGTPLARAPDDVRTSSCGSVSLVENFCFIDEIKCCI